jgi:hypothetical protein
MAQRALEPIAVVLLPRTNRSEPIPVAVMALVQWRVFGRCEATPASVYQRITWSMQ